MSDPSPLGYTVTLTGMALVWVSVCWAVARRRLARVVLLLVIVALLLSLPVQVGMARGWERARQPTPAPVESTPVCGPGQIGPYQLDGHLMCIPQDQAG